MAHQMLPSGKLVMLLTYWGVLSGCAGWFYGISFGGGPRIGSDGFGCGDVGVGMLRNIIGVCLYIVGRSRVTRRREQLEVLLFCSFPLSCTPLHNTIISW